MGGNVYLHSWFIKLASLAEGRVFTGASWPDIWASGLALRLMRHVWQGHGLLEDIIYIGI